MLRQAERDHQATAPNSRRKQIVRSNQETIMKYSLQCWINKMLNLGEFRRGRARYLVIIGSLIFFGYLCILFFFAQSRGASEFKDVASSMLSRWSDNTAGPAQDSAALLYEHSKDSPTVISTQIESSEDFSTCRPSIWGYTEEQLAKVFPKKRKYPDCAAGKTSFVKIQNKQALCSLLTINCKAGDKPKYVLGTAPNTQTLGVGRIDMDMTDYTEKVDTGAAEYAFGSCKNLKQAVYINKPSQKAKTRASQRAAEIGKHKPLTVILLIFDSVSRAHFYRSLPLTVDFIKSLGANTSKVSAYDFKLNNVFACNSEGNMVPMIYGRSIEEHRFIMQDHDYRNTSSSSKFKAEQDNAIWKWYEKNGFVTMFGYDTTWDFIVKSTGRVIEVDHQCSNFWKGASRLFNYKENSQTQRCFGMKESNKYLFDYGQQFVHNYKGLNRFAYMHVSTGHEDSGYVLRSADTDLRNYLNDTITHFTTNSDGDFVLMLISDHGKNGGFDNSLNGFKENLMPAHFIFANKAFIQEHKASEALLHNTQILNSRFDWHLTFKQLATAPYGRLANETYNGWKSEIKADSVVSLMMEKAPKNRTCEDLGVPSELCICRDFEEISVEANKEIIDTLVKQGVTYINHQTQNFSYLCNPVSEPKVLRALMQPFVIHQKMKVNLKVDIQTNEKAVFELHGFIQSLKGIRKSSLPKGLRLVPPQQVKYTFNGVSEQTRLELRQVVRGDSYRGLCEQAARAVNAPHQLCICDLPYEIQKERLQTDSKLTDVYNTLLARLNIGLIELNETCSERCQQINSPCSDWGLQLIDNFDVLNQSWVDSSLLSRSLRIHQIKRVDQGDALGIKNDTLFIAPPQLLSCDSRNQDMRLICPCLSQSIIVQFQNQSFTVVFNQCSLANRTDKLEQDCLVNKLISLEEPRWLLKIEFQLHLEHYNMYEDMDLDQGDPFNIPPPPQQALPVPTIQQAPLFHPPVFHAPVFHAPSFNIFNSFGPSIYDQFKFNPDSKYQDDQVFNIKAPAREQLKESVVSLSVKCGFAPLSLQRIPRQVPCMVSLRAKFEDLSEVQQNRPGLDLVCVIDISGSMVGSKIQLVITTLKFMLTILTEYDRVSLVLFDHFAYRICPLTNVDAAGLVLLTSKIDTIQTIMNNQIQQGLRAGLRVLRDRRIVNQVTAILLLSDGVDSINQVRINAVRDECDAEGIQGYSIHTFGYGRDHDPNILQSIARKNDGNFYYVEDDHMIADAFANCLGELATVVAERPKVAIIMQPCQVRCSLGKVYSEGGDCQFNMPSVLSSSQKDTVFMLSFDEVANEPFRPLRVRASYTRGQQEVVLEEELVIECGEERVDKEVMVNFERVKGADYLKELIGLANRGDYNGAVELARRGAQELRNGMVADEELVKVLAKDIEDAGNRASSQANWNKGGFAQASSLQSGHFKQQAAVNTMAYQNQGQSLFSSSAKTYFGSNQE